MKKQRMRNLFLILLAMVLTLQPLPAQAKPGTVSPNAEKTIYASSLKDNDVLELTAFTELIMDTDRTLKCIKGNQEINIRGDHKLTVNPVNSPAFDVHSLGVYADTMINGSSKYAGIVSIGKVIVEDSVLYISGAKNGIEIYVISMEAHRHRRKASS